MDEETKKAPQLIPFHWKKGVSGNPKGRPAGKSLKEFTREYMQRMTEEERLEFLEKLGPEVIWKMAEGNPPQKTTLDGEVTIAQPIYGGKSK